MELAAGAKSAYNTAVTVTVETNANITKLFFFTSKCCSKISKSVCYHKFIGPCLIFVSKERAYPSGANSKLNYLLRLDSNEDKRSSLFRCSIIEDEEKVFNIGNCSKITITSNKSNNNVTA